MDNELTTAPEKASVDIGKTLENYTKAAASEAIAAIVADVDAGDIDPREAFAEAHKLADFSAKLKKALKDRAWEAMVDDAFDFGGAHIEKRGLGSSWAFGHDSRWRELKLQVDDAMKALKAHEQVMKAMSKADGSATYDTETGEVTEPAIETPRGATLVVTYK